MMMIMMIIIMMMISAVNGQIIIITTAPVGSGGTPPTTPSIPAAPDTPSPGTMPPAAIATTPAPTMVPPPTSSSNTTTLAPAILAPVQAPVQAPIQAPVDAPVPMPTTATVPTAPNLPCPICSVNQTMMNGNVIVNSSGLDFIQSGILSCTQLAGLGEQGFFSPIQCIELRLSTIPSQCGCMAPTLSPVVAPPSSLAPVSTAPISVAPSTLTPMTTPTMITSAPVTTPTTSAPVSTPTTSAPMTTPTTSAPIVMPTLSTMIPTTGNAVQSTIFVRLYNVTTPMINTVFFTTTMSNFLLSVASFNQTYQNVVTILVNQTLLNNDNITIPGSKNSTRKLQRTSYPLDTYLSVSGTFITPTTTTTDPNVLFASDCINTINDNTDQLVHMLVNDTTGLADALYFQTLYTLIAKHNSTDSSIPTQSPIVQPTASSPTASSNKNNTTRNAIIGVIAVVGANIVGFAVYYGYQHFFPKQKTSNHDDTNDPKNRDHDRNDDEEKALAATAAATAADDDDDDVDATAAAFKKQTPKKSNSTGLMSSIRASMKMQQAPGEDSAGGGRYQHGSGIDDLPSSLIDGSIADEDQQQFMGDASIDQNDAASYAYSLEGGGGAYGDDEDNTGRDTAWSNSTSSGVDMKGKDNSGRKSRSISPDKTNNEPPIDSVSLAALVSGSIMSGTTGGGDSNEIDTNAATVTTHTRNTNDADSKEIDSLFSNQLNMVQRVIVAPSGRLGIVIDTTIEGPVVHKVFGNSPLDGKVFVGDIIIAIDDTDTRAMSAAAISDLMVKTANQARRLTVLSEDTVGIMNSSTNRLQASSPIPSSSATATTVDTSASSSSPQRQQQQSISISPSSSSPPTKTDDTSSPKSNNEEPIKKNNNETSPIQSKDDTTPIPTKDSPKKEVSSIPQQQEEISNQNNNKETSITRQESNDDASV